MLHVNVIRRATGLYLSEVTGLPTLIRSEQLGRVELHPAGFQSSGLSQSS